MIKLDKIDKKILFELDRDCRQPVNRIARKLRISRDIAQYRIKQLEKNKIIENYYTLINTSKMGYQLLRIYIKFQNTTPDIENEIITYLINEERTLTVYRAEGDWDIATGILAKNISEMNSIWDLFQQKYKKYINDQNLSVMYEFVHFAKNYLVEEKDRDFSAKIIGEPIVLDLDENDKKILKIISTNAKIPLIELAKQVGLTSAAISYKLKNLMKNKLILAYKALIDYNKLGYEYFKLDLFIEDIKKKKSLQEFAKIHPNVVYEDRTFGGSDFEFDVELENYDELFKLIEDLKTKFPGLIRTYKYYKARKIFKYNYLPPI